MNILVTNKFSKIINDSVFFMQQHGQKGLILAGHYCVAKSMQGLSSDSEVEQGCFELGIQLVKSSLEKNIDNRLVLWINDIGIDLEYRNFLKEKYQLPDTYKLLLDKYEYPHSDVIIMFESTIRNKGSVAVRKIEQQNPHLIHRIASKDTTLVRCIEDDHCSFEQEESKEAMIIKGPRGENLVLKDGNHPKCCLILGTLFNNLNKKLSPRYIVNIFNSVYTARLEYGIHVSRTIYMNKLPILNLYVDETNINSADFSH